MDEPSHGEAPDRTSAPEVPEDDSERAQRLKRTVGRYALIVAAIALVLAVWGVGTRIHARSELERSTAQNTVITVATVKPTLGGADAELVLPGIVQAYTESPIYARTNGYLKTWRTDIGARVRKGELLAEIDTPEVDRQLAQARADLATAQANLDLAVLTNQRWQGLLKTQAVSQQDADNKAGDAAAKLAIVDSARENVKRLEELESFKRVVAPFDGIVTARNTDIGYLINAGEAAGTELFRMADLHRLRIYAQVPQAYAAYATAGLKAELHFVERPGQVFYSDATRTSSALDPSARTLQVELELENSKAMIFPGSYTDIHFKLPSSTQTLRLPANTILFRSSGLQVAVVQHGDTIHLKDVVPGRDFGKTLEILSGLEPDDAVVVNPPDSISEGTRVRLAPPRPAPEGHPPPGGGKTS